MALKRKRDNFDDLGGVDLSTLDLDALDAIDLDFDQDTGYSSHWLAGLLLLGAGGGLLWLPESEFFQTNRFGSSWVFPVTSLVAGLVGLVGGRWLWQWAQAMAQRAQLRRDTEPRAPKPPPGPVARAIALGGALLGFALVVFGIDRSEAASGGGVMPEAWWLASAGGMGVTILMARWLLMQQHNPFKSRVKRKPIQLPPWLKWANLAGLLGVGLLVLMAPRMCAVSSGTDGEFGLGGAGIIVGAGVAIWLVRRFDETEAKIKAARAALRETTEIATE